MRFACQLSPRNAWTVRVIWEVNYLDAKLDDNKTQMDYSYYENDVIVLRPIFINDKNTNK